MKTPKARIPKRIQRSRVDSGTGREAFFAQDRRRWSGEEHIVGRIAPPEAESEELGPAAEFSRDVVVGVQAVQALRHALGGPEIAVAEKGPHLQLARDEIGRLG